MNEPSIRKEIPPYSHSEECHLASWALSLGEGTLAFFAGRPIERITEGLDRVIDVYVAGRTKGESA